MLLTLLLYQLIIAVVVVAAVASIVVGYHDWRKGIVIIVERRLVIFSPLALSFSTLDDVIVRVGP